jgi:hypothetical protein
MKNKMDKIEQFNSFRYSTCHAADGISNQCTGNQC